MLLLLFSSLFIIPVLAGFGKIIENFSGTGISGMSGKILSGIIGINLLWTLLCFFIPLNGLAEIPVILLGLLYFFKDKLYREFLTFSSGDFVLISIITSIILFCGSFHPYILDHFGYYVPTIKWLTEFGLVKGISNLDLLLGQMSVWHIFQAGFSNFSDPFLRINAVLLIVYALYIIEHKSWIQLCFIPVLLFFSQSPSPDLPVIVFSLILLNEILKENKGAPFIFAFSVFVFTLKPTMIWLPLLGCFYSVLTVKSGFRSLLPGLFIAALFCIKNIWTFGYPVFPIAIGDLGAGWKPNPEVLKISSQYAIQKTYDMQYSYEQIQKFSKMDCIRNWLFLEGIKSKINILFILSLAVFIIFSFFKKNKTVSLICISILIKSILVLSFSAQYRFFIDVFFVIFFVMFKESATRKKSTLLFSALSFAAVGSIAFPGIFQTCLPSFKLGNFMEKFETEQLYKPSVYEYNSYHSYKVGNLIFQVSRKYPYNFDTALPAISESYLLDDVKAGIFPQMKNPENIRKGFIWKKLNPYEQKKAESISSSIKNSYQQK